MRGVLICVRALSWSANQLGSCKANLPNRLESSGMTAAKRRILVRGKSQKNPLPDSGAIISDGKEAFSHYCVVRRGLDGQHTGVPFASRKSPPVLPLSRKDVQSCTRGQLKWVVDYGIWSSGMPGSKDTLSDDAIWSIAVYLRQLPATGSLGEPEMYSH